MLIAQNNDCELKAKLDIIIDELERYQKLNGGKWIGSVPEKYFQCLEKNEYIWSPQYTLHKTLLGLYHSAMYAKNEKALDILNNAADWYLDWTADMQNKNPHAVYSGEEGGMLEVWAGLYQLTGNEKHLTLAERYSNPSIFKKLADSGDSLSSCHANASIPWAQGAPIIFINGEEIKNVTSKNGYFDIDRTWENDTINIYFPAALTISSLPDMPKLTAFAEGLAGLCEKDCGIYVRDGAPESALTYTTEHTYSTFPWQQSVYRTVGQPENFDLVPLYDITDEPYTVYFTKKNLS